MKKRKIVLLLSLLGLFLLGAAACSAKNSDTDAMADASADTETAQTPDEQEQGESSGEGESTDDPEKDVPEKEEEEKGIRTLHMMTGCTYENAWNQTYQKNLVSVSYPSVCLEDCCLERYPELEAALTAFNKERKTSQMTEFESMQVQAE